MPKVAPGGVAPPPAANPHPGHDYYVDTLNGSIQRGYMAATIRFLGHPIAGPFDWAQAVQVANQSNLNKDVLKPADAAAAAAAATGSFLGRLSQASTWIRVGEVVAGLILLGIGLNSMLGGRPLKVVTGAAGAVGKVVP